VNIKVLGQLGYLPVAFDGGKRLLRLEGRCVVPRRGRLFMVSPDPQAYRARRQAETPLSVLFKFAEPALVRVGRSKPVGFSGCRTTSIGYRRLLQHNRHFPDLAACPHFGSN
jgi:hypothetical protein